MDYEDTKYLAKGNPWERMRSILFLLPAWFAPHTVLRVFFHKLRGVRIGRKVEIGYFCMIGNVHPSWITIEDGATVASMSIIVSHDNSMYYSRGGKVKYGKVLIKKRAFVGVQTTVLPGVTIGEEALVGACSLVNIDVPPRCIVGGVPIRILKTETESEVSNEVQKV